MKIETLQQRSCSVSIENIPFGLRPGDITKILVREPILILRRREIQAAWLGSRMHGLHGLHGLGCMLHENEWGA